MEALELDWDAAVVLSKRGVFKVPEKNSPRVFVIRFQSRNDGVGLWRGEELVVSAPSR